MLVNKMILLLCVVFYFLTSKGQSLLLSGHVQHTGEDSVELNIPFSEHYYKDNSVYAKPDSKGDFHLTIQSAVIRMVLVRCGGKEQWVLLSPQRDLYVDIDPTSIRHEFRFSGKGKKENELLLQLEPQQGLWFTEGIDPDSWKNTHNPYIRLSKDSLVYIFLPMVKKSMDSSFARIAQAGLPERVEKALVTEVTYYYASHLEKYFGMQRRVGENENKVLEFGIPNKEELYLSRSAKEWTNAYLVAAAFRRNNKYDTSKDKEHAEREFIASVGFSHDQQDSLAKLYGGYYMWVMVNQHNLLPPYAEEMRIADFIFRYCDYVHDLKVARKSFDDLQRDFPASRFLNQCRNKIAAEARLSAINKSFEGIHIRSDGKEIQSIEQLLAPYTGKVVFVDFWGTWCHSCIDEMYYAPSLKDQFKGKDIVFLYVDNDPDDKESRWLDFLRVTHMTGEHLRMNNQQINILWKELKHTGVYPSYFIFDKKGNLVVSDAKLPSDGKALYDQLSEVLNKP